MMRSTIGAALLGPVALPIYEFCRPNIEDINGRIRPFDRAAGFTADPWCRGEPPERMPQLEFSGWRLAHAVKKAERMKRQSFSRVAAAGFLLDSPTTFDWRSREFRLRFGEADGYADFSRTSLSGRTGQGIALLVMEQRGLVFSGRYVPPRPARGPRDNQTGDVQHTRG